MGIIQAVRSLIATTNTSADAITYSETGTKRLLDVKNESDAAYRSSFGDHVSESLEAISQISAQYGINPNTVETFTATGGGASATTDNLYQCTTGTSAGGYGVIRTKKPTVYREGQGLMARFTAVFDETNAVDDSLQFAGLFNVQDTIAFGYRGSSFGILLDNYGAQEQRKLQITVSGNGTLALTLNSVQYDIPITSGTVNHNAYEIEAWMNANQSVWNAEQVGDSVLFQSKNVGALSGTYSVSGASLSGTFTTLTTGAAKTESTIAESDWNGESVTFDKSKGNVFMIKVSYLGFGPISFYILCPTDRVFKRVHTIDYQNTYTKPSISNIALKVGWVAASLGSTTDITVQGASAATFIEGKSIFNSIAHAQSNSNASVDTSFEAILTIKALGTYNSKAMLGRIFLKRLVVSTDSTKEVVFKVSKNATLGETDFNYHDSSDSIALYDTGDHADTGNAHALYQGQVGSGGAVEVNLKELGIDFYANETITIFAKVVSGAASDVTASITWVEDF